MGGEEAVEFLQGVPPFDRLAPDLLRRVARGATLETYPAGSRILAEEGPASDLLRIIRSGGVKVFVTLADGQESLVDHRSEGEAFGFLSLVSGDRSRASVVAVEDTTCLLIPRADVLGLLEASPAFAEHFLESFLGRYIDRTFAEMRGRAGLFGAGDRLLFTTPAGELASKRVRTAAPGMAIRDAAAEMSRHGVSSLVVVDEQGGALGIVTDRDLREKVVARERAVTDPVSEIMSPALVTVEARDYCFEALLKMLRHNIHHLPVLEEGRLRGVITNHDLMMLQGTSPVSLAREIEGQTTVAGLAEVARGTNRVVAILLKEGARAGNITRVISEINDRLLRRVLELAEGDCGPPPVPYCWLAYGSEGRREQTFRTDQDNALLYQDPEPGQEAAARDYFTRLATFTNEALVTCGFPPCPGGYMASNPKWCQPLAVWKAYFEEWIRTPDPEAILASVILFDFRPVHGALSLGTELRAHLTAAMEGQDLFLKHLADLTVALRPPLGFFRTFAVERSGEHKDQLNLKFNVVAPLINIVRLFGFEAGVSETGTLDRIAALAGRHEAATEHGDELVHAFEFVTLLRIHHQFAQIEAGREPDNFVNPDHLSTLERKTLKDACQLIGRLQDFIARRYQPGTRL